MGGIRSISVQSPTKNKLYLKKGRKMKLPAYKIKHRYPWAVMQTAIKMYHDRYTFREVSENLAKKGITVSHKTVYEWVKKFDKEATSRNKVKELRVREK